MNWHKMNLKEQEDRQRQINNARRNANQQNIKSHQAHILAVNASTRQTLKG